MQYAPASFMHSESPTIPAATPPMASQPALSVLFNILLITLRGLQLNGRPALHLDIKVDVPLYTHVSPVQYARIRPVSAPPSLSLSLSLSRSL